MSRPFSPGAAGGGGGGGATFRDSTITLDAGGGDIIANKPAGVVENDYLVAFCAGDGASTVFTAPGGWTPRGNFITSPDGAAYYLFDKIASSSEPANYTFNNDGTLDSLIIIAAVSNVNTAAPRTFVQTTAHNTLKTSPIAVGATGGTAAEGDCILYFASMDKNGVNAYALASWPASYTEA